MRFRLRLERSGVSVYLEVFLLIALASGGTALVIAALGNYGALAQGPGLSLSDPSLRQGNSVALERFTLMNTGAVPLTSFTVVTRGIPPAQYFVTLADPSTGTPVTPSTSSGTAPSTFSESVTVPPGGALTVSLSILNGAEFQVGGRYTVLVNSPQGAQAQVEVQVVPP